MPNDRMPNDRMPKDIHVVMRRWQVSTLLDKYPLCQHGTGAAIARELGVHRSTICRDLQAIAALSRAAKIQRAFEQMPEMLVGEES